MSNWIELEARDAHRLKAWHSEGRPSRGGLVLIQEVFGVNAHIRAVAGDYAAAGWDVLAPALFERVAADTELDYDENGITRGRELVAALGWDAPLRDIAAAASWLRARHGSVCVLGYCWGGTLAALCATRLGLPAISYYGARSTPFLHERPQAPLQMHFGRHDALFSQAQVDELAEAWPQAEIYRYEAGHGFNCDARNDYHAPSAALARERSLAFLASQAAGTQA